MPMPPETGNAWKRLGRLLADRRVQIGARYRNKNLFAEERQLNRRMIWSVEKGDRDNYGADTLRAVEAAYMLTPGSVRRTLAGGPLEPAPEPYAPRPALPVPAGTPPPSAMARALFPGDPAKQRLYDLPEVDDAEKAALFEALDEARRARDGKPGIRDSA